MKYDIEEIGTQWNLNNMWDRPVVMKRDLTSFSGLIQYSEDYNVFKSSNVANVSIYDCDDTSENPDTIDVNRIVFDYDYCYIVSDENEPRMVIFM